MQKRRRFKQTESLTTRLTAFAKLMRERAKRMPLGAEKSEILSKARQAEAAAEMDRWLRSPELRPPE